MSLTDVASVAVVVQTVAIVLGVLFALRQIRQTEKTRNLQTISMVFEDMHDPGAYRLREQLLSGELDVRNLNGDDLARVTSLVDVFQRIGFLVTSGFMRSELVFALYSGIIVQMWTRLKPLVESGRGTIKPLNWGDHFERLAHQAALYRRKNFGDDGTGAEYSPLHHKLVQPELDAKPKVGTE